MTRDRQRHTRSGPRSGDPLGSSRPGRPSAPPSSTRGVDSGGASGPLVMRLLEVLDEFELALTAAERVERSPDMDRFIHGVEIVYAKLIEILKAEGLERIE